MADPEVKRYPIMLNPHCIALLTLYIKPHDNLDDCWTIDYEADIAHDTPTRAAQELVSRLEDHWAPAFMMALRDQITAKLREHDQECGTNFAGSHEIKLDGPPCPACGFKLVSKEPAPFTFNED